MAMSRKDYIEVARILRDSGVHVTEKEALAEEFASWFKRDNSRFDRDRFYSAIGLDTYRGNPGKFNSALDEALYQMDHDEEFSIGEGMGWFGLATKVTKQEVIDALADSGGDISDDELNEETYPLHAIVSEDSQGFVTVSVYDSAKDAEEAWDELVERESPSEEEEGDGSERW